MKNLFNIATSLKAYAGAGGAVVGKEVADAIAGILVWLISLAGVQVPENVQGYVITLITLGVAYLFTWIVPNKPPLKQ